MIEVEDIPLRNSFTIYRGDQSGWFPVVSDGYKKKHTTWEIALDNYVRLKSKLPQYGWAIKNNRTGEFLEPEV